MEGCPIKDKNWNALLKAVNNDEKLAYKIWESYGNVVPPIDIIIKDGFIEGKISQPRFQPVIDTYINKKKDLHKRLTSLKSQKKFKSTEERNEVKKNIAQIESQIDDIDTTIESLEDAENVENVYIYAQTSLEEVKSILAKPKVTSNDLIRTQSIIKLWKRIGQLDETNPFFSEDELKAMEDSENITAQNMLRSIKNIQTLAESLDRRWTKIAQDVLLNQVRSTLGEDVQVDLDAAIKDIGKAAALLLGVSEVDNAVVNSMFVWRKQATHEANKEYIEIEEGLNKVFDKVYKKYTVKQLEDIFKQRQSNTNNDPTGDIVHRFSQSWFEFNEVRRKNHAYAVSQAEGEAKKNIILKNRDKLRENAIIFDPRILFPEDGDIDKVAFEEHKAELISNLGEKGYQFYYDRMKQNIDNYNEAKLAEENYLNEVGDGNEAFISENMDKWVFENSPYITASNFSDIENRVVNKVGGEYISPSFKYLELVPRKTVNGKDTGFYDKNFNKVESDSDLFALYNYLMETMHQVNQYLPDDKRRNTHINTLPFVAKDILEQFSQSGLSGAFSGLKEGWQNLLASPIGGSYEDSASRDIEGNKLQEVLFNNSFDSSSVIKDYIDRKTIEFRQKNLGDEKKLIDAQIEWRKEIQAELTKQKSFDIEKVVKLYSLAALSYKHKSKVEDSMKVAYSIINTLVEQQTNNAESDIKDQWGKPMTKKGLPELKSSIDFMMSSFFGEPTTLQEIPFGDKVYSDIEKKTKKELELLIEQNVDDLKNKKITKEEYQKRNKILSSQLHKLGKIKTVSNVADTMNMYIRLKGLGWKVFSPIANMNVGYISNITEASAGTKFTTKELHKGYSLVFKKDKKLKNIIKKLDATKDLKNEAYQSSNLTRGWKRKIAPFYLMSESEYVNQAPVVYGLLAHTKVTVNGKEMSLYEAYDENGELPEGVDFSKNKGVVKTLGESGMKIYIDDTISRIHGNYDPDNQIQANKYALGRSLLVFRKWMISTFYNRLGAEKLNKITGISEKGRWRSYSSFFKNYGGFNGSFAVILALLKKASFQKTSFEKLNETDEANMKRNLTEITSLIAMMSMALLLKAIAGEIDWDDEDKKRKKSKVKDNSKYLCFFLINQLGRTERDILFYIDPQQFKSVLKDPVPLMGVVTDTYDLMEKSVNLLTGGEDKYKTGRRKGDSKVLTALRKVTPGTTNYDSFKMLTDDILNK